MIWLDGAAAESAGWVLKWLCRHARPCGVFLRRGRYYVWPTDSRDYREALRYERGLFLGVYDQNIDPMDLFDDLSG